MSNFWRLNLRSQRLAEDEGGHAIWQVQTSAQEWRRTKPRSCSATCGTATGAEVRSSASTLWSSAWIQWSKLFARPVA